MSARHEMTHAGISFRQAHIGSDGHRWFLDLIVRQNGRRRRQVQQEKARRMPVQLRRRDMAFSQLRRFLFRDLLAMRAQHLRRPQADCFDHFSALKWRRAGGCNIS